MAGKLKMVCAGWQVNGVREGGQVKDGVYWLAS